MRTELFVSEVEWQQVKDAYGPGIDHVGLIINNIRLAARERVIQSLKKCYFVNKMKHHGRDTFAVQQVCSEPLRGMDINGPGA
jgi:hypothetical protein